MAGTEKDTKLNPEILWLVAIFVLAMALRIIAASTREMLVQDETSLLRVAQNLLAGKAPYDITGATGHYPILYPLVTASFEVVNRHLVAAGYAVSILFSSLMILPTYLFGKMMWNMRTGRAAAALVAVLPVLVDRGSSIDGQNLFGFWLLCGMFFGYRMQFTKRCMCGMLSGICMGIAYLSDPSALYYLVVLFALLLIIGYRQELSNYANRAAAHFALLFLVFAVPYMAFMTWENGRLTLADRPVAELYAAVNNLKEGTIAREQGMYSLASGGGLRLGQLQNGKGIVATALTYPGAFAASAARGFYDTYISGAGSLVPVWLLPLIGLGLFRHTWTRREALKFGYFALVMAPLLIMPVLWGSTDFMLPYLGIVMLWVARGWVFLADWGYQSLNELRGWHDGREGYRRRADVLVAALVLVPLAAFAIWNVSRTDYPLQFRWAGDYLASHGDSGATIMSRETSTAWYAGGNLLLLPYASIGDTINFGRRNGAAYLVVSRQLTDTLRPQLKPLMNINNRYRADLEPVYHSGEGTSGELIVYHIKG